jgi:hypothetical protein
VINNIMRFDYKIVSLICALLLMTWATLSLRLVLASSTALAEPRIPPGMLESRLELRVNFSSLEQLTLVWNMNSCGECTGFAVEAYEFVLGLKALVPKLSFINGPALKNCLCPGYTPEEIQTLESARSRTQLARNIDGGHEKFEAKTLQKLASSWALGRSTRFRYRNRRFSPTASGRKPQTTDVMVLHLPPPAFPSSWPFRTVDGSVWARPRFLIGRSMTEGSKIAAHWVHFSQRVDELWVPASFLQAAFVEAGVPREKVHVVAEAVHPAFFQSPLPKVFDEQDLFRFLAVGKWEARKGITLLLSSYFAEFTARDRVVLILKTFLFEDSDSHNHNKIRNKIQSIARDTLGSAFNQSLLPAVEILTDTLKVAPNYFYFVHTIIVSYILHS